MDHKKLGVIVVALFAVSTLAFAVSAAPPLTNWSAPPTYTPAGKHAMANEIGLGPFAFFPITPCRQYNSSGTPLTSGVDRTITLSGAPCGIQAGSLAVSVNITIFNITGAGGNGVVKVGTAAAPTTAWINYPATETQRANAGVLPLSGAGAIVVQVAQGGGTADIIVDVNGYYYNGNSSQMPAQDFFGIRGNYVGGSVLYGQNVTATAGDSFGTRGQISSTGDGSSGIRGEAFGATGATYGVLGTTTSTSGASAGVKGIDGTGASAGDTCCVSAGVFGESAAEIGVFGISQQFPGLFRLYNAAGVMQTNSVIGFKVGATNYAFYAATGDYGGTGAKYFVEPHPTDAAKVIHYISLEGGEAGTYSRGTAQIEDGFATIQVPSDFRMVTEEDGMTVLLTPVGAQASMYIVSQDLNSIVVRASRDVKFHYMINGVRRGYKSFQPVGDGTEFMPMSPGEKLAESLSAELKHRLIANGTYNEDGTVNMRTAERMGWTKIWADHEAARAAGNAKMMAKRTTQ